jgi:trehalose/maltose hydrolase-like predicted phosphorylase
MWRVNVKDGCHIAAMGGTWMAGRFMDFAGMRDLQWSLIVSIQKLPEDS